MNVAEFRQKISLSSIIVIGNKKFKIRELIKFRLDDGSFYTKCFLNDDFILADDLDENIFIFVAPAENEFREPFPKELNFQGKNFKFLYTAHAVAEEVSGEEIFVKGESERFWDYQAKDGSYLSLGITDQTDKRLDFAGKVIEPSQIDLE